MKTLAAIILMCHCTGALASDCPVTIGSDRPYVDGWPIAESWYGSRKIAVILPAEGIWPTTKPGNSISVKLFWYLEGFEAGLEAEFDVSIQRIGNGQNDARADRITNAGGASLGASTALIGIDFPSEGCWKISGTFRGNSLTFVVKTEVPDYRSAETA